MSLSRPLGLTLVLSLGASPYCQLQAGTIKGVVVDRVQTTPTGPTPVHPATVKLLDQKSKKLLPQSAIVNEADGSYEVTDVPPGEYSVVVSAVGYVPNGIPVPDTEFTATTEAVMAPVAKLMRVRPDGPYAVGIAKDIAATVLKGPEEQQRQMLRKEWLVLTQVNLPPSARVDIAKHLTQNPSLRLKEVVPEAKAYLEVDQKALLQVESLYGEVMEGKKPQPGREILVEHKLAPEILGDIAIYQLKKVAGAKEQKEFLGSFLKIWGKSPVAEKVLNAEKRGFFEPALLKGRTEP